MVPTASRPCNVKKIQGISKEVSQMNRDKFLHDAFLVCQQSSAGLDFKNTPTLAIDHSTTQRKLRPFLGVQQATRKDDAAECKSTLDLLPEDLSLSCFGEGKLTQRSIRQGYHVFFCAMPFSWFLFCHVEHRHLTTCTKACQTISGLVCKTRGRLIAPQHAIA